MNAIQMLRDDHTTVKRLFGEFEAAGERAHQTKGNLVTEALTELEVHAALEEELFYPAVDAKADRQGKQLVDEAEEEHHVAKLLMAELRAMTPEDDHFAAKFMVLMESVRHHIEEEERELLPQAKELLGDEVEQLGEQMAARKAELTQRLTTRPL
jgi:hemerythrin-like domain-containing protein